MKCKIVSIRTFILKGFQRVELTVDLGLEVYPRVFLSADKLKNKTGLSVVHFEQLIGGDIDLSILNTENGTCVSDFYIDEGFINNLPIVNIFSSDFKFYKIDEIFTFERKGKSVVGMEIFTSKPEKIYIPLNRLCSLTSLPVSHLKKLIGCWVNPEYYQEGETFHGGGICYSSDKIIKELNLRIEYNYQEVLNEIEEDQKNEELESCFNNRDISDLPTYSDYFNVMTGENWADYGDDNTQEF